MLVLATTRCNLSCSHCLGNFTKDGEDISVPDFEFVLQQLKGLTSVIILSGGEPFLNPNIEELISLTLNQKFLLTITTNGTLLAEHKQFLKDNLKRGLFVQVTHDDRYYTGKPDYPTIHELGLEVVTHLPTLSQTGRARDNNFQPYGRVASLCANPILLAHQTHNFKTMIASLDKCFKFCSFCIHPNLDFYLSECHKIRLANLKESDWQDKSYNRLLLKNQTNTNNVFCNECDLGNSAIFEMCKRLPRKK